MSLKKGYQLFVIVNYQNRFAHYSPQRSYLFDCREHKNVIQFVCLWQMQALGVERWAFGLLGMKMDPFATMTIRQVTRSVGWGMPDPYEWWGCLANRWYLNWKSLFNEMFINNFMMSIQFAIKYHFKIVLNQLCREQPCPSRRNHFRRRFHLLASTSPDELWDWKGLNFEIKIFDCFLFCQKK